jgi:hypothetical protein
MRRIPNPSGSCSRFGGIACLLGQVQEREPGSKALKARPLLAGPIIPNVIRLQRPVSCHMFHCLLHLTVRELLHASLRTVYLAEGESTPVELPVVITCLCGRGETVVTRDTCSITRVVFPYTKERA